MNRRTRSLLLLPATVLLLASCGGAGDSEEAQSQPYVDEMAAALAADESSPMDEEEARCFSEGFVDVVGVERMEEAGTPEEIGEQSQSLEFPELELTRDEGDEIYDQFEACGVDVRDARVAAATESDVVPEKVKACIEREVTDEVVREIMVTLMIHGEEAAGELDSPMTYCLVSGGEGPEKAEKE